MLLQLWPRGRRSGLGHTFVELYRVAWVSVEQVEPFLPRCLRLESKTKKISSMHPCRESFGRVFVQLPPWVKAIQGYCNPVPAETPRQKEKSQAKATYTCDNSETSPQSPFVLGVLFACRRSSEHVSVLACHSIFQKGPCVEKHLSGRSLNLYRMPFLGLPGERLNRGTQGLKHERLGSEASRRPASAIEARGAFARKFRV